MKIALLTDSDVFAGTERHMLDLGVELRALGAEPSLVCPAAGVLATRGQQEGLPVVALEKRAAVDPAAIWRLSRWLANGRFDVIHAHNGRTALFAAVARRLTSRGHLVATQHFLDPARAGRRGLAGAAGRSVHQFAGERVDYYIAISQAVADAMLARGETTAAKVRVVLNGIRDPRRQPLQSPEEVRAKWKIPPGAPLIVCLSRLEREKSVETLIAAMKSVAKNLPAAHCIIAGSGSLESDLRRQIGDLKTVTISGFVEDSLSLVNAADLFALPSLSEPFGLAIVEAMALEKPVIVTRSGGPLEIVRDPRVGVLTEPQDSEGLAAAITRVLSDPTERAKMGAAAREEFLARFTAKRMAADILAVYQEAMNGPRPTA